MIAKSYIRKNLRQLDTRFRAAKTQKDTLYVSKLAIPELCGWIELSMDDIILRVARKRIKDINYCSEVEKMLKHNYGFHYANFRKCLIFTVGVITMKKIESKVNSVKKQVLQSELGTLTVKRNELAHEYLKGTLYTIDAPSVTINRFERVYDGMKEYETIILKVI